MRILIINGPNLNLLGKREPDIYGSESFETILLSLRNAFPEVECDYFQSNIEGELIDQLQQSDGAKDGIILNAGGYTHTSISIGDAVAAIAVPVVEVHLSNVYSRESYRHESKMAKHCLGVIAGFGPESYSLAIQALLKRKP